MTVLFRCRVEKSVLEKTKAVTQHLGTETGEVVRIFLAEIARTGKVPVCLSFEPESTALVPWGERAEALESFYNNSKTW